MVRFLAARSDAVAAAVEPGEGEVEPHDVAAGFRVDPRAAWIDATTGITTAPVPLPPDWSTLVNQTNSMFAIAMAVGNFPQSVRDLHPLLTRFDPARLRPGDSPPPLPGFSGLRGWIRLHAAAQPLVAAGIARLLGDFDDAARLLPSDVANERAALEWHRGRSSEALAAWIAMPDSPTVLFNRGMALLFFDRTAEAKPALAAAVAGIPDSSGWNALARLYLALAEMHS